MAAVKVNKDLAKYVDFDPTKESVTRSLRELCSDIEKEAIVLPIFQTYIRWQIEKSIALLNFQLRGFAAVSPISINRIRQKGNVGIQISFIDRFELGPEQILNKDSIIDGQQRLTCNYKAYIGHQDFNNVYFDISIGKFLLNFEAPKNSQVPVGVLYNKDPQVLEKFISERSLLQPFNISNMLNKVRNKFMSYYYIVNIAYDLTEKQQLEWFEVLNLAGTKVTGVQVELTEMLVKGVDFYSEYTDKFLERLREADMSDLLVQKSTEISIPLALLNPAIEVFRGDASHKLNFCPFPSDVKASLISKFEADNIRNIIDIALEGLDKAIAFIEENLDIPERIDYVTYLAGAFMYIGERDDFDRDHLIKWYKSIDFLDKSNTERREIFEELILPYFKLKEFKVNT
ncbi:GmrSD restriction endonuclease domain-containing protein [Paenibacillus sp. Z3-2]